MNKPTLQHSLLVWYSSIRRDLPWRGERDPYRILLAEVLLQQTRVEQAIPFYQRFLEQFPSLQALGLASQEEVLMVWQGAGYYSRARNLHKLAVLLLAEQGDLPTTFDQLHQLPGIGPYTAAAVASIAFGHPVAAVDGNVRRVISRLEAWANPTASQLQNQATLLLQGIDPAQHSPGDWNQALMELGATICAPHNPKCGACPIYQWCRGRASPAQYPTPKVRVQKPFEYCALVLIGPEGIHLEPRSGRILGGLWGVPMEENPGGLEQLLQRFGLSRAEPCGVVAHAFTHRKLTVQVYRASWDAREQPSQRPLSQLDRKVLKCAGIIPDSPLS